MTQRLSSVSSSASPVPPEKRTTWHFTELRDGKANAKLMGNAVRSWLPRPRQVVQKPRLIGNSVCSGKMLKACCTSCRVCSFTLGSAKAVSTNRWSRATARCNVVGGGGAS